jgi:hypothetical protein
MVQGAVAGVEHASTPTQVDAATVHMNMIRSVVDVSIRLRSF